MKNYQAQSTEALIRALEVAGGEPEPGLIEAIWGRRAEAEPLLLALFREAYHDNWVDDDPRWYRFVHAGNFMRAWRNEDALPVFADLYMNDELQDWCEWFEEELAEYGPPAVPHFAPVLQLDTGGEWHYGQALASGILRKIAQHHPETREEVLGLLRAQLPTLDSIAQLTENDYQAIWTGVAADLAELHDEESQAQILALFDLELIDEQVFDREWYLETIESKEGGKTASPFDIVAYYRNVYDEQQWFLAWRAAEARREAAQAAGQAQSRSGPKIGRNDPCPCGSGKKYKHCHGRPGA